MRDFDKNYYIDNNYKIDRGNKYDNLKIDKIYYNDKYINNNYIKIDNNSFLKDYGSLPSYDNNTNRNVSIPTQQRPRPAVPNIILPTTPVVPPIQPVSSTQPNPQPTSQPVVPVQQSTQTVPRPIVLDSVTKGKIEGFLKDMFNVPQNQEFRGWILPNGKLMSQYNADIRQDHGKLTQLFIKGLEQYDKSLYDKVNEAYDKYRQLLYAGRISSYADIYESFSVDVLGWMQVAFQGSRYIVAQAANWQNKFLAPFVANYGFAIDERQKKGEILELDDVYKDIMQIIQYGLEKQESSRMVR